MIIYSWNILYRNRELDRAFEFISHTPFDIFCLQEVPEAFLERLKTLPYTVESRVDTDKLFRSGAVRMYNVILSKHPIEKRGEIPFSDYSADMTLFTRLFVAFMRPFHLSLARNRGGLYADVVAPNGRVRIFNLHLALTHPSRRLAEFELAMAEHDPKQPAIVCGDFNIIETRPMTLLNWLMGGRLSDAFLATRERTQIEERFVSHSLVNALSGSVTHSLSRSQLDHILVSHSFSIKNAEVLPDTIGSDHHPIRVEVA